MNNKQHGFGKIITDQYTFEGVLENGDKKSGK